MYELGPTSHRDTLSAPEVVQPAIRLRFVGLLVVVVALVASACTADDEGTSTTTAGQATTTEQEGTDSPATTAGDETPTTTATGDAQYGGTLEVGLTTDPTTLHPYRNTNFIERNVNFAIYDSLVRHDLQTYEKIPSLAESWEVSDDGLVWTFNLRPGVQFHDGRPFTAEDAKWSVDQGRDPGAVRTGALLASVEAVNVVDDDTIEIQLSQPDNQLLSTLVEVWVTPNDSTIDYEDGPIGTGPFMFESWERGQELVLTRNDNYWMTSENGDQLPYLDSVVWHPVPDGSVRALQVQGGDIHVAYPLDFATVEEVEATDDVYIARVPEGLISGFYDLRINVREEPLANPLVRQAMSYAIDREAISEALFGLMLVDSTPTQETSEFFNPEAMTYVPRDVERARELLAEAGYPDGVDVGVIITEADLGFVRTTIPQLIQQHWAEAGITVAVDPIDSGTWVEQVYGIQDFDMGFSLNVPKPDEYDPIAHAYGLITGAAMGFNEQRPEFEELLTEARLITDPDEYKDAIMELQAISMEEQPMIHVGGLIQPIGVRNEVQDFIAHAQTTLIFTSVWLEE